jgi:hypothetical protein
MDFKASFNALSFSGDLLGSDFNVHIDERNITNIICGHILG